MAKGPSRPPGVPPPPLSSVPRSDGPVKQKKRLQTKAAAAAAAAAALPPDIPRKEPSRKQRQVVDVPPDIPGAAKRGNADMAAGDARGHRPGQPGPPHSHALPQPAGL